MLLDALIFPLENLEYLVAAILFIYGYFYAVLPCVIFILMRFSMLRWYLDPFAAAEIPLTLLLMLFAAGYLRKFGFQGEALRRLGSFLGRNWGWLPAGIPVRPVLLVQPPARARPFAPEQNRAALPRIPPRAAHPARKASHTTGGKKAP